MGQAPSVKRVVLDTNIVVSALLFGGVAAALVTCWKEGALIPLASADTLKELARVLSYPKFKLAQEDIDYLLHEEYLPFIEAVVVHEVEPVIPKDPSDDVFLALAEAGHADAIVSGDDHLLSLKTFRGKPILTLRECLENRDA